MHWSVVLTFLGWLCLFIGHQVFELVDDGSAIVGMFVLVSFHFVFATKHSLNLAAILVFSAVLQLLYIPLKSLDRLLPFSLAFGYEDAEYFRLVFSGIYALAIGVFWPRKVVNANGVQLRRWVESLPLPVLQRWLFGALGIWMLMPILGGVPVLGAILDYFWKSLYILAVVFFLRGDKSYYLLLFAFFILKAVVSSFFFELGLFGIFSTWLLIYSRRVRPLFGAFMKWSCRLPL